MLHLLQLFQFPSVLFVTSTVYILSVYTLRNHAPFPRLSHSPVFVRLAVLHNILLAVMSLFMNLHASFIIYSSLTTQGLSAPICISPTAPLPSDIRLAFQIFHVSKFYELIDTFLLIVRGRPLTLLHVWHHTSVMYETWGWLHFRVPLAIFGLWFNTLVHVIMYTYYAMALLGHRFPFKKAITKLQIIQFITGFVFLVPFTYFHLSRAKGCAGISGLLLSAFFNASYLALFVTFFRTSYVSHPTLKNK